MGARSECPLKLATHLMQSVQCIEEALWNGFRLSRIARQEAGSFGESVH